MVMVRRDDDPAPQTGEEVKRLCRRAAGPRRKEDRAPIAVNSAQTRPPQKSAKRSSTAPGARHHFIDEH